MSQAGLNRIWAQAILEDLQIQGVKHICIAPGSRSTPLSIEALELAQRTDVTIHTHFDERGLGFLALGLAKASDQPVAVIVTSGTAVANLLPSVAESGLTREKLILLTADRPDELIAVGANQAILQQGIFSTHVIKSLSLPSPSLEQDLSAILLSLQQAMAYQRAAGGSLHINCPYPEPLYLQSIEQKLQYTAQLDAAKQATVTRLKADPLHSIFNVAELTNTHQQDIVNHIHQLKVVVVIGKMPQQQAKKVKAFADKFGWVVLCDPQSGVSSDWAYFDLWLQHTGFAEQLSQAECILQFGARLVSKRVAQWIKKLVTEKQATYWVFNSTPGVINPDRLPQLRTVATMDDSLEMLNHIIVSDTNSLTLNENQVWADQLRLASVAVKQASEKIKQSEQLTECQVALCLDQILAVMDNPELFIGNSLIVRLLDMLSAIDNTSVFTNRGASGIDGLIATAAGVQRQNNYPMLTLIGDTSLLYDLNSLALLNKVEQPQVILVTNNDGGAIFDLLPVPDEQKQTLYQMPHGFTFEFAAKQFNLQYGQPQTLSQCIDFIEQYLQQFLRNEVQSALVIEVQTPPEQASQHIQTIVQAVKSYAL